MEVKPHNCIYSVQNGLGTENGGGELHLSLHRARGQIGITMLEFAIQYQALFLAVGGQEWGYCKALGEAGVSSNSLPLKGEEELRLGLPTKETFIPKRILYNSMNLLEYPRSSCGYPPSTSCGNSPPYLCQPSS